MTTDTVSIEVKNIFKKLGPNQALNGISTKFDSNLLHGIIGPEGAGKTTLLRTLLKLLKPDSGEIIYSIKDKPVEFSTVRQTIAYMPQQQSLYADLSVIEHLDFFRDLYQIPLDQYQERRDRLLHITRLDKFKDRPAGNLSGGMYKKLGLMCALLQSPTVLLLDEPTNGVDPISRREFWMLLYQLLKENILIIYATAYMDEAERCDWVHLIFSGQLIGSGKPRSTLEQAQVKNFDELFIRKSNEAFT